MLAAWKIIREVTAPARRQFERNASQLASTQATLLQSILANNRNTQYGSTHQFNTIKCVSDYQKAVPLVQYDDIAELMALQCQGINALCADKVLFFEPTSGSSTGRKRIPYTQQSLVAMQSGINAWLSDLVEQRPLATQGKSYWSISPVSQTRKTCTDGTPIGAPSDLDFLAKPMQSAFVDLLAVPPSVAAMTDRDEWRYHTLFGLIVNADLSMISVWSPSFLTTLVDAIPRYRDRLITAASLDTDETLERLLQATTTHTVDTSLLWPALDTISCWTHGAARQSFEKLRAQFPRVHVQAKGLLATEAVITIPYGSSPTPVLAPTCAFFEFMDDAGKIRLAHELEQQATYEVIVTTHGGLYRYALGDVVRVNGFYQQLPALEFMGRSGVTSDLCGEKLTDSFVTQCLDAMPGYCVLTQSMCDGKHSGTQLGYTLFVDASMINTHEVNAVASRIDLRLQENPQYAYALALHQLATLKVCRINDLENRYIQFCTQEGQLLGDVKPVSLCIKPGLAEYLTTT